MVYEASNSPKINKQIVQSKTMDQKTVISTARKKKDDLLERGICKSKLIAEINIGYRYSRLAFF
jgi:hypothetical protein